MTFVQRISLVAMFCALVEGRSVSLADNGNRPVETSVKVLRTTVPAPQVAAVRAARRPPATPTTPGAKYPQYQLSHPQNPNSNADESANPRLRFFLNLPNETLLVEVKISIDDLPFPMVRRNRVERILRELVVGRDIPLPNVEKKATAPTIQPASNIPVVNPVATSQEAPVPESNLFERLRHTINLTGEKPTAEEIDWLISNWIDGPTLMQLNDNFQRFRANQRPEFVILDRNRDGTISADELQAAVTSFQECDLNQDGLIQFTEIAVAAIAVRTNANHSEPGNLITLRPDETSATLAYERLTAARPSSKDSPHESLPKFDTNRNGQFDADELQAMCQATPDLQLSISFDVTNPENSRIAMIDVAGEFLQARDQARVDPTGITLTLGGVPVIFAAVQGAASDQISIGAVNDGYPLLPSLDPNDDGRLTVRELRGLIKTLTTFDTNQDGALTVDETQSPIRVCFGLGPVTHRELAGIRSIHRKPMSAPVAGPEWFVRMDRNKDNDLSRGEFPGTDDQFRELDSDADELVSSEEALEFDKKAGRNLKVDGLPASRPAEDPATDPTSKDETKPQ